MRARDRKTAERYGVLERCEAFEADLLKIKDIVPDKGHNGVPFDMDNFDLTGFIRNYYQVIIIPKYDIRGNREDYWKARRQLLKSVIEVAEKHDLALTDDRIEDYGEHFYFVFRGGAEWGAGV